PGFLDDSTYKYPVLFLLHGFMEQGWSYKHLYNIKSIADEMISTGEIQPMIIVMPNGAGKFGGSFFTNSVTPDGKNFGGKYEDYITQELRDSIFYNYGRYIRGIVYKVTYDYDTNWTITYDTICMVTTTPCPPDSIQRVDTLVTYTVDTTKTTETNISDDTAFFRRNFAIAGLGNGGYGAIRIATDYPLYYGSASAMSAPLHFASFADLIPAFLDSNGVDANGHGYYDIDPINDELDRLSSLFFAMAVAFSPHDPADSDTTTFFRLVPSTQKTGVDLPFDSLGNTVSSIWQDEWLANDLLTRILSIPESNLRNLKLYIDCGNNDEFSFDEQSQAFYDALPSGVKNNTIFEIYSGYPGYPAYNNSFVYDRLRKVLKFHSDCFTAP
ncbi:MAG: esterase family protein, partial [candidate division Zixibacteria bacterium]|nr:esterase family protein [candidate division Zixibacteria bacterium]